MFRVVVYFLLLLFLADSLALADSRSSTSRRRAIPQCRDRKDNDNDGRKDYPRDRGCKNRNDNSEKTRAAPTPTPRPTSAPIPIVPGEDLLGDNVSLNGYRPFPNDNPWNVDISADPVDPNSSNLISSIGIDTGLHPDFGTVWNGAPSGIQYTVVSANQPKVNVTFDYDDESDAGPYPIPIVPAIEGGPNGEGDRHIIMVDKSGGKLYELFYARKSGNNWLAGSGAIFDLTSNALRPLYWTSADAAGLPIFPGLVRYDEVVEKGEINHALRFTVSRSRRAFVSPARHFASSNQDVNLPPMGMRVRLKASVDISRYAPALQVILKALKKYGMFVSDNGSNWYISGAPDPRWNDDELGNIRGIKGRDFEVVKMGGIVTN